MDVARQIPWLRIFVEGAVIVGSILLAFGVDAWWSEVQDREAEQQALAGLASDFTANAERIRTTIRVHEAAEALVRDLGKMSEVQLSAVPPDSVRLYVTAQAVPMSFDPQDGTLDAIIASGRLELITDTRLREALVEWKSLVEDAEEEVAELREWSHEARRLQSLLGGPFRGSVPGLTVGTIRPTNDNPEADLRVLAGNSELMAVARSKIFTAGVYIGELGRALSHAEDVLDMIEASLGD